MTRAQVLVAMSGGVDSSVAAALLLDDGWDVVGVTMKLWGGESDTGCCSVSDVDDARRVAQQLGIDHVVFNFGEQFAAAVVEPYVRDHAAGRTPNPCIECNRHLKFDALLQRATQLGIDAVATGHHARVWRDGDTWRLGRGADRAKDQSYVVHMLGQDALRRTLFPVGAMTKDEVRRRAAALGLCTASKPDSQDVCFIPSRGGRSEFLARRLTLHPGSVVDRHGNRLSDVAAIELVTLGQRRGLGLPGGGDPAYVVDVDVERRVATVGPVAGLLRDAVSVEHVTWVDGPVHGEVLVQCSAHGRPQPAIVTVAGDRAEVCWADPQPAVAAGQSVVLFDRSDTWVLGGGIATRHEGHPTVRSARAARPV